MKRTMRILAVILMMAIKILKKILGEQSGFFRHIKVPQQIFPLVFHFPFSVFHSPYAYSAIPTTALRTSSSTGLCL